MSILAQQAEVKNLEILISRFKLQEQLELPHLTDNYIDNENLIQKTIQSIRSNWLKKVAEHAVNFDRSPWEGQIPSDLWGNQFKFSYETLLSNDDLPDYFGYDIKGYQHRTYLFPNGMAAIKGTLDIIDSATTTPLKIYASVGYFETVNYLNMLVNRGAEVKKLSQSDMDANVFIFEPMLYNFTSNLTDEELLITKINESSAPLKFLIMDSTMHNVTKIFSRISTKLKDIENIILIDVRSGLKLDQSGLELTNLGIAVWFINQNSGQFSDFLFDFIQKYKGLSGTNLPFIDLLALAYNHKNLDGQDYLQPIKNNVSLFINNYSHNNSKYIQEIRYGKGSFFEEKLMSPFIFFKLNSQKKDDYICFIENIKSHFNREGLFLPFRNSWGFRYPSIEFIEDYYTKELIIKVYLGEFQGIIFEEILEIFNNLSSVNPSNKLIKELFNK